MSGPSTTLIPEHSSRDEFSTEFRVYNYHTGKQANNTTTTVCNSRSTLVWYLLEMYDSFNTWMENTVKEGTELEINNCFEMKYYKSGCWTQISFLLFRHGCFNQLWYVRISFLSRGSQPIERTRYIKCKYNIDEKDKYIMTELLADVFSNSSTNSIEYHSIGERTEEIFSSMPDTKHITSSEF